MWNRTWQTYSSVVYIGAQELISKWKKIIFLLMTYELITFPYCIVHEIWRTKPYCYSLVVWAKSVAPNSFYCKIFENFMESYLMCTSFWNVKGATKASVLIPWQRSEWLTLFALPILKKIRIYQVWFLFGMSPGVDSYSRHFGTINK